MTDTHFSPGATTAYVTDHVIALSDGPGVDPDAMARCAHGDWSDPATVAAEHHLAAVAVHRNDQLRVALSGDVTVDVVAADRESRFDGTDSWTTAVIEHAHLVTLTSLGRAKATPPIYRVDVGAVPASVVSRRLVAPAVASMDAFDMLFGPTVQRSVESAAVRFDDAEGSPRGPLGVLVFSNGQRTMVDADIVVGRHPRRLGGDNDRSSRLVRLDHPGVSRQHAHIRFGRRNATVEDLGSVNGTTLALPGRAPAPLRSGRPVRLAVGSEVELAGQVSFTVEETA